MTEFIFVAIVCTGANNCEFFASTKPITQTRCEQIKSDFLALPFKNEVTTAAAQCMTFNGGTKI